MVTYAQYFTCYHLFIHIYPYLSIFCILEMWHFSDFFCGSLSWSKFGQVLERLDGGQALKSEDAYVAAMQREFPTWEKSRPCEATEGLRQVETPYGSLWLIYPTW